jgi:hypothetical protein
MIQNLKNQIFLLKKKFKNAEEDKVDIFGEYELPKWHTFTFRVSEGLIIRTEVC